MTETSARRGREGFELSWTIRLYPTMKRCVDLVASSLMLLALMPVLLVVYVAVRTTSAGGGIYRKERVGAGGRTFWIYKFRTMHDRCSEDAHRDYVSRLLAGKVRAEQGLYKLEGDDRITRVGGWLRRTSMDELPQLVNVLRGDMSLVGPRPALPWEVEMFPPWAHQRHAVRPGLTGLWQVSGRNRLTMTEGLRLDVDYVQRAGLLYDLGIMLRTVPALLNGGAR
jgi:lipopolysaccharide/colanic/teichoic acid biosynthesis glycosyltransferase